MVIKLNKKLLVLFLLCAVLSASVAFASETVEVEGLYFNIPSGFEESTDHVKINETYDADGKDGFQTQHLYSTGTADVIGIEIYNEPGSTETTNTMYKIKSDGNDPLTVNGVEGYWEESIGGKSFNYFKDGKCVTVVVPSQEILDEIIINPDDI